jgi:hypothetical protein
MMSAKTRIRPYIRSLEERARRRDRSMRRTFAPVIERMEDRTLLTVLSLSVTNANDSGSGSLRAAILCANAYTDPDGSVIEFAPSMDNQTITLASTLELSETHGPEIIDGSGANVTVSGGGSVRVFRVDSGVSATMRGLTVSGGMVTASDPNGGGLDNAGSLILDHCTISGNDNSTSLSNTEGGGINNTGTLKVVACNISNNGAISSGGGIENTGTACVINSIVHGNGSVFGTVGRSGGIDNWGTLTCTNSTIAYNSGGVDDETGSTTTLDNTIVALNVFGSNVNGVVAYSDIAGLPVSKASSYNLIGVGGSGVLTNGSNGNQVGIADPGIDENGIPVAGSPAIDGGSNALAVDPTTGQPLTTDITGSPRIVDGTVDIGAYEFTPPTGTPTVYVVDLNSDTGPTPGDLRWAVTQAATNTNPAGTLIEFDPTVFNAHSPVTITLTSPLVISSGSGSEVIQGPGMNALTISGDNSNGALQVSGYVKLSGFAFEDTQSSGSGIGMSCSGFIDVADCSVSGSPGIGIFNTGLMTTTGCTVSGNGNGINNEGYMTVQNCTVKGSTAVGIENSVAITIIGSTITGNHNEGAQGAGIDDGEGAMVISDSTIDHNDTADSGGGIFSTYGGLVITNCTIAQNSAGNTGGGVCVQWGELTITNSTIALNQTSSGEGNGGGVYVYGPPSEGSLSLGLFNTIVVNNTDPTGPDDIANGLYGGTLLAPGSGYNLVGKDETGLLTTSAGNLLNPPNPGLDPCGLQDNGGPTKTIALLPGSNAIDAGNNALAVDTTGNPLTYDQRGTGFLRVLGSAVDIGAYEYSAPLTPSDLQTAITSSPNVPVTISAASTGSFANDLGAVSELQPTAIGMVSLALSSTTYQNQDSGGNTIPFTASAPPGVTLTISCPTGSATVYDLQPSGGNVDVHGSPQGNITLIGQSPALTVTTGQVTIGPDVTLTTATASPTILVTGGTLTIRGSVIQESTGSAQAAILVTGGRVDLGTAADPGNNVINVNGAGQWVVNTSGHPIPAVSTAFTIGGAAAPSSLSGLVFADFNDDGQVDFGEQGIPGVPITLTGTDDLGDTVSLSQTTDGDGTYVFLNLRPGSYTITETQQPAGYTPGINSVGTGGGTVSGAQFTGISLVAGEDAMNYNYGEQPAATGAVHSGQTAGIGFWNNKNGQALIKALNGGAGTQLGDWLAATFPHMFGAQSGSNDLAGQCNAYIATFFQGRFVVHGQKLDAQVLATALAVYVTDPILDNTGVATQYGFSVGGNGVATSTYNIGSNGAAFQVANNTTMTVMEILLAADSQAVNGVLYNGDTNKRNQANNVFSSINEAGGN